jgi:hypothetical protein
MGVGLRRDTALTFILACHETSSLRPAHFLLIPGLRYLALGCPNVRASPLSACSFRSVAANQVYPQVGANWSPYIMLSQSRTTSRHSSLWCSTREDRLGALFAAECTLACRSGTTCEWLIQFALSLSIQCRRLKWLCKLTRIPEATLSREFVRRTAR